MRILRTSFLVLTAWLAGATVSAHEGGTDARGTVKEVASDRLVLTDTTGTELTVALGPGTRIRRGHRAVAASEIRPGERAVVHAAARAGKLEATEVKLAEVPE